MGFRDSPWPARGSQDVPPTATQALPGRQGAARACGLKLKALCCNQFRVFVNLDKSRLAGLAVASDCPRGGDIGVHGIAQGFYPGLRATARTIGVLLAAPKIAASAINAGTITA